MVEMALVLPLLLLLTMGAMEYSWLYTKVQHVTNAARHGVRLASMPDATDAGVRTEINTLLARGDLDIPGVQVVITGLCPTPGEPVRVTINVPYQDSVEITRMEMIPVPATIGASVCMAKEGP